MALRLRGATSGYIELKAPASAGDNTLTLPTNNGSANTFLKTDGSGNLSWQSNLTFDGNDLIQTVAVDGKGLTLTAGDLKPMIIGNANRSSANNTIFGISGKWNNTEVGRIAFEAGSDTDNKDDGKINFYTRISGGSLTSKLLIETDGKVGINETTPEELLDLGETNQQNLKLGQRGYLGQAYSTSATILGHSVKAKTTGTTAGGMIVTETNSGGGAPAAIRMESGIIQFHTSGSGTADADFDSERLRIESSGNVKINDGDLIIGTAGHGIDFSAQTGTAATGAATGGAGSEILDHYEEGTWTPVANFGTSGSATVVASGHFTRVGRIVNITWTFYTTAISSPSGTFTLTGLPFSCLDHTNSRFGVSFSFIREFTTDMPNFKGLISGGTTIYFYKHATNSAASSQVQGSDFTSGSSENYIYGSATYMAA